MSNHAQETSGASQPQVGGGWLLGNFGERPSSPCDNVQESIVLKLKSALDNLTSPPILSEQASSRTEIKWKGFVLVEQHN